MKRLIVSLLILPIWVFAYTPTGFVNDFAGVLSPEQKVALEEKLKASTNEIAVVIVPSLEGDYIEHYAVKMFEEWGIGGKEKDNGLLLLIAIKEKELRIEVGYGLEPYITDSVASSIINDVIVPEFKKGDYYAGIDRGIDKIIEATNGVYEAPKKPISINSELVLFLVFFIISILASSKSWWLGGVIGGIFGLIIGGVLVTVGLILLGLLIDFIVSKHGGKGGPFFFGGGSHHGGGGFSGFGGGMSGGGGASGRW